MCHCFCLPLSLANDLLISFTYCRQGGGMVFFAGTFEISGTFVRRWLAVHGRPSSVRSSHIAGLLPDTITGSILLSMSKVLGIVSKARLHRLPLPHLMVRGETEDLVKLPGPHLSLLLAPQILPHWSFFILSRECKQICIHHLHGVLSCGQQHVRHEDTDEQSVEVRTPVTSVPSKHCP